MYIWFSVGNTVQHKGHDLVSITYHIPTACEVCTRPLWHMFRPPQAYECRREYTLLSNIIYLKNWFQLILFLPELFYLLLVIFPTAIFSVTVTESGFVPG